MSNDASLSASLLGARSGTALGDDWVRSACIICLNRCGILAHVTDDGTVDKILGDPDNPHNHGKTCAKGDAGMEGLRDAERVTTPLRRTNPDKGIGVDPGWVPISWEDALSEIAARLKEIRDEDPTGLLFSTFDAYQLRGPFIGAWINAFGLPGFTTWSAQIFCGNNVHGISYMNQSAFEGVPDPVHSRYIMLFGSQFGSVVALRHDARRPGPRRAPTGRPPRRVDRPRPRPRRVASRGMGTDPARNRCRPAAGHGQPARERAAPLRRAVREAHDQRARTSWAPTASTCGKRGTGKPMVWDASDGRGQTFRRRCRRVRAHRLVRRRWRPGQARVPMPSRPRAPVHARDGRGHHLGAGGHGGPPRPRVRRGVRRSAPPSRSTARPCPTDRPRWCGTGACRPTSTPC